MLRYPQKVKSRARYRIDEQQKQLTSAVGLDVGDTEGSILGLCEGDFDGLLDGLLDGYVRRMIRRET